MTATATKTSLKKWIRAALSRLFHLVQFVKCWQIFLELNSKRLYAQVQEKKKKVVVLCSRPLQNVNLGTFML